MLSLTLNADEIKFSKFIDNQLLLAYQMDDKNITQEAIKEIVSEQELNYDMALDELMANKSSY
ncbi:MAG: hypothetical protein J7K14_01670, partial [Sulfurimonas sp.]|nr:hypothetical protein [Sulfurimonas sp.]